jgi:hypothetical protein
MQALWLDAIGKGVLCARGASVEALGGMFLPVGHTTDMQSNGT